jgi:hypothetical protein
MTRHYFADKRRSYPSWAPRVLWNRLLHVTILGPLLGCSCSRCFHHRWRLYWWREGVGDRLRLADAERRITALERRDERDQVHDRR